MITRERLDQLLSYDPGTDTWTWRVNRGRMAKAGSRAGTVNTLGYRVIQIDAKHYLAHRLVWFWHHGEWPALIDHIDMNRSNNRVENLRPCEKAQNLWNVGKPTSNTSGLKGASYHKDTGRWQARIRCRGISLHLGLFDTVEEAHKAYVEASMRLHGEFSRFNPAGNAKWPGQRR